MKKVGRPIIQCDLKGTSIKKFPSAYQAIKDLEIKPGLLNYVLKTGGIALGKWKFRYEIATDVAEQERIMKEREVLDILPPAEYMVSKEEVYYDGGHSMPYLGDEAPDPDRWATPFERILRRREE